MFYRSGFEKYRLEIPLHNATHDMTSTSLLGQYAFWTSINPFVLGDGLW